MAAPASVDELLELIRRSDLLDEKQLTRYLTKLQARKLLTGEPAALAERMLLDGLLTRFQAEQLMQGKWRGFSIGNYRVLERLGSGNQGNVFLCVHQAMQRPVAVKILAKVRAQEEDTLKRFYREARLAASLEHPNLARAYDIGEDNDLHFLVMDYVDGTNLDKIVKKFGPLDILRAAHYVRQAALGLQYAHNAGLVHRDIKPANLILGRDGVVKVLDMGIARSLTREEENLTHGLVLGSADFLAPEQAVNSHAVDYRADVYGLGATFYYLLTARLPMEEGKTLAQKLMQLQSRAPRPLRELRPDVPDGLVRVVDKMMAKDQRDRYRNCDEVAEALTAWTRSPIGPPSEAEMPQLSVAALSATATRINPDLLASEPDLVLPGAARPPAGNGKTRPVTTPSEVEVPALPIAAPTPDLEEVVTPGARPRWLTAVLLVVLVVVVIGATVFVQSLLTRGR